MIVFGIVPIHGFDYEEEREPVDYRERVRRATALAEETGGRFFEEIDASNHTASAKILGVIIPIRDMDKVATLIRNNPDKYRLGKDFYSGDLKGTLESLDRINEIIQRVTGKEGKVENLPKQESDLEVLRDKKIVTVSSDGEALKSMIPRMLVATNWKADFLLHRNQSTEDLATQILATEPEVIFLEYFKPSIGVTGPRVAKLLIEKGFKGKIIGFSASPVADKEFKNAGALGSIMKIGGAGDLIWSLADQLSKEK